MSINRTAWSLMLAGAASVIDGMASIAGSMFDRRPSPRMKRVLDDLKLSDGERLRRDWERIVPHVPQPGKSRRTPR